MASSGCTRTTSSFLWQFSSNMSPGTSLNCRRTSAFRSFRALPQRRMNGTPGEQTGHGIGKLQMRPQNVKVKGKKDKKNICLTVPSLILDVEYRSSKRGCAGTFRDGGVVLVTQPGVALPLGVPHVLAEDHIWQGYWGYTLQYLHLYRDKIDGIRADEKSVGGFPAALRYLLVPHIIWTGSWRFLHGNQTEHLEEMILHDISKPRKINRNQTLVQLGPRGFFGGFFSV